jgi:hypothetical protein
VTPVPPVALDGDEDAGPGPESAPDVVVVPSQYSDLGRVAANLERQGYDVVDVGGDDWEPVASLLPYLRAADVVVCSGYSTVMDAAVAGTPCVVHPATDEQEAVADRIQTAEVSGFAVAETPMDVLDAVASPPDPPSFENGATDVAESVLGDLQGSAVAATEADSGADNTDSAANGATLADRAVGGVAATGTAARATAHRSRRYAGVAWRRGATGAAVASRYGRRAGRVALRYGTVAATALTDWSRRTADRTRRTAHRSRRYATAVTALSAATLVVTSSGLRSTGGRLASGSVAAASTLRRVSIAGLERTAACCERLADGLEVLAAGCGASANVLGSTSDRLGGLGRRVKEVAGTTE